MATCEELMQQITTLQAALVVDAATIQAAQNIQTMHQMQLWYAQYNFFLQGCGGSGEGTGSGSGSGIASGTGDGSGSGSGSGFGFGLMPVADSEVLIRNAADMILIAMDPKLMALHKRCEEISGRKLSA